MKDRDHNPDEPLFNVIDRRLFTEEGELRDGVTIPPESTPSPVTEGEKPAVAETTTHTPIPPQAEVPTNPAFFELLGILAEQASMMMGGMMDPRTNKPLKDKTAATHFIDMMDMLQEKTRGNLSQEETSVLTDVIAKIKLKFFQTFSGGATKP